MAVDFQQSEQFIHAGKHQELFRLDPAHPAPIEHLHDLVADRTPVPVQLGLGVDLLADQVGGDPRLFIVQRHHQCVRQRVGRIGRGDQGAVSTVGRGQGGGGGDGGLAHPPFTGDENYPHQAHLSVWPISSLR